MVVIAKWRLCGGNEMTMAMRVLYEDAMVTVLLMWIQCVQVHWLLYEALRVIPMLNHLFM